MRAVPTAGCERGPLECAEALQKRHPARAFFSSALLLLGVALGGFVQAAGPEWLKGLFQSLRFGDPGSLMAIALALALSVVIHEAGHLFAAVTMDFQVLGISFGPLRFDFWQGRMSVRLVPTLTSGSVSAIPRTCKDWRRRMLTVIAAGPSATAALGCLAAVILNVWHNGLWGHAFFAALVQLNFFLFVLGLVPNGARARVRNDARLFCVVWEDSEAAEEIRIWHELSQFEARGTRPKDYPPSLICRLNPEGRSANLSVLCAKAKAEWAMDRGDLEEADAWDRYALSLKDACDERIRNAALAASGFFDVVFRNNLESARGKFSKVRFDTISPVYAVRRLRAAAYVTEGKVAAALAEIYAARQLLSQEVARSAFEIELLRKLHKAATASTIALRLSAVA